MRARVLIAGCGDVGTALGLLLVGDGHQVHALRRNVSALPAALAPLAADLAAPESLSNLPEIDYLFYTAAADGPDDAAYACAYVSGVENLLAALRSAGQSVRHAFFVSSTGVYGQDAGEIVDETSATLPVRFTGARLLQGERTMLDGDYPASVVRFGGIYGPGRTRLLRLVKAGASCNVAPPRFSNRIHRDDCAGVLRHLMGVDAAERIYLGVDCEPAAQCEVMEWLAKRLNAPPPAREIAAGACGQGKRCSNARLLESGYEFRYPTFREGYGQIIGTLAPAELEAG